MLVRLANRLRTRQVALTPAADWRALLRFRWLGVSAMGRFDRAVVIVSGAARGQGLAIAQRFAPEGADVAIGDIGTTASGGTEYALSRRVNQRRRRGARGRGRSSPRSRLAT